jgi:5'-3' exonuclease
MNWIKQKLKWLKDKWSIIFAGVIIAFALFRNRKSIQGFLEVQAKNNNLQKDATDKVIGVYDNSLQQVAAVTQDTQDQLAGVKQEGDVRAAQIASNEGDLIKSLSGLTNDELVEILKKENES